MASRNLSEEATRSTLSGGKNLQTRPRGAASKAACKGEKEEEEMSKLEALEMARRENFEKRLALREKYKGVMHGGENALINFKRQRYSAAAVAKDEESASKEIGAPDPEPRTGEEEKRRREIEYALKREIAVASGSSRENVDDLIHADKTLDEDAVDELASLATSLIGVLNDEEGGDANTKERKRSRQPSLDILHRCRTPAPTTPAAVRVAHTLSAGTSELAKLVQKTGDRPMLMHLVARSGTTREA